MKKTFTLLLLLVTMTTNLFAQDTRANAREADITIVLKDGPLEPGEFTAQQLVGMVALYVEGEIQFKNSLDEVMTGHIEVLSKKKKDLCVIDISDMSTLTGKVAIADDVTEEDNIFCNIGSGTKILVSMIPLNSIGIEGDASKLLGNAKSVALIFDVERKDPTAIKSAAVSAGTPTALGIYDLQGRRVALPQQGSQLPKGIYVVNGYKVVVK
ncbi:MAG: hypothetical protein IKH86_12100 [Prevotella sp.]|nr:hypothetical protein [Prevotella sp.]